MDSPKITLPVDRYHVMGWAGFILIFLLSGCSETWLPWVKAPSAKPGDATPLGNAQNTATLAQQQAAEAQAKLDAKVKEIAGQVRANVQAAAKANEDQVPGNPTVIVRGELGIADQRLSSVPVDPVEVAETAKREALVKSGEASAAQAAYKDAASRADQANQQLASLTTAKDQAIVERDAARTRELAESKRFSDLTLANANDFEKKWKDRETAVNKIIEDERNDVAKKTQFYLTMGCYGLGVLCVIGAAVRTYMAVQTMGVGLVSAAKSAGTLGLFAALFFALGRLTSQPWFWWACGIVLVITVIGVVAIFVIDAKKTKALAQDHAQVKGVSDDLITAISDIRNGLKKPSAALVQKVQQAKTPEEASAAVTAVLTDVVNPTLSEYVTEGDGTAAYVDNRRRALALVSTPDPVPATPARAA